MTQSSEASSGSPAAMPSARISRGIMGAFGAALIARERYMHRPHETAMLSLDDIIEFDLRQP